MGPCISSGKGSWSAWLGLLGFLLLWGNVYAKRRQIRLRYQTVGYHVSPSNPLEPGGLAMPDNMPGRNVGFTPASISQPHVAGDMNKRITKADGGHRKGGLMFIGALSGRC